MIDVFHAGCPFLDYENSTLGLFKRLTLLLRVVSLMAAIVGAAPAATIKPLQPVGTEQLNSRGGKRKSTR